MALTYEINDAARSLDQQQALDWQRGWQVVDPGGGSNLVTAGSGDFEYDAASGDINAGGSIVTCSQETVDFATDIDANDDQMAVIYRDSSGTLQKSVGSTGTRDPSGEDPRSTHTPAPPTLHNTNAVVLAEVLLPAGASSVGASELRDRRLAASLDVDTLLAATADVDAITGDVTPSEITDIDGDGLEVSSNTLQAALGDGVEFATGAIQAALGDGLDFASGAIQILDSIWDGTNLVADVDNSQVTTGDFDITGFSPSSIKTLLEAESNTKGGAVIMRSSQVEGVGTSLTEIFDSLADRHTSLFLVWGDHTTDQFVEFTDFLHHHRNGTINTINSINNNTPDGRTYNSTGGELDLAMDANEYDVVALQVGLRQESQGT